MENHIATLARWLLVPVFLLIVAGLLYFVFSKLGWKKKQAFGLALVSPWIVGFLIFTLYPLFESLYLSFTESTIFGGNKWAGAGNYIKLFTSDIEFWPSVRITLLYAALSLPIGVIGALLVAMLLNNKIKGIGAYRTIYFLPAVMPEVAVALLWRWMFNSESGIINYVLSPLFSVFGVDKPNWFGDPHYVLGAFIIMSLWGIFGTNTVVFLAGLQGVPSSLYEAAEIDGAGRFAKFKNITIPQISPVILLQVIMGMIGALQIFTIAMFVRPTTAAGKFMNQLVYERGFTQLHMGEASAVAWVLFIIILALTLLVFRSSPAWVHYESDVRR
ncbi:MAG: sugar ABC transporter permease [Paenibacillus macerans]|uniref:ABC transporter permease subunit n=1 Tax=Paenibacillus macerans TaxID=44252 RepID=A0A6N8EXZ2_PAEMA|nr:sugar ABC transporter permease [Paenibacillus macerans]MDU7477374.1 sugar ABC transporter permease [Paenibacillus macerans]MED4955324.1 sugar ABC transporter permease [Paenibacillus macerans]MUG25076.1 ABC transporter permease subunit [Paenibacillus macerans]OMG46183.1 ABC transporter permease [Paenibacillus macerans]UMV47998.1 sugar ABC transporter permease [Paenibacillus macerans]